MFVLNVYYKLYVVVLWTRAGYIYYLQVLVLCTSCMCQLLVVYASFMFYLQGVIIVIYTSCRPSCMNSCIY